MNLMVKDQLILRVDAEVLSKNDVGVKGKEIAPLFSRGSEAMLSKKINGPGWRYIP